MNATERLIRAVRILERTDPERAARIMDEAVKIALDSEKITAGDRKLLTSAIRITHSDDDDAVKHRSTG